MRKYWYYTFKTANNIGNGVSYSDDGEFDIVEKTKHIEGKFSDIKGCVVIDNWHEISSTQYEKLSKYFADRNK